MKVLPARSNIDHLLESLPSDSALLQVAAKIPDSNLMSMKQMMQAAATPKHLASAVPPLLLQLRWIEEWTQQKQKVATTRLSCTSTTSGSTAVYMESIHDIVELVRDYFRHH